MVPIRPTGTATGCQPPCPCRARSEEHTSELQSQSNLVCRLLLEKKKKTRINKSRRHTAQLQSQLTVVFRCHILQTHPAVRDGHCILGSAHLHITVRATRPNLCMI